MGVCGSKSVSRHARSRYYTVDDQAGKTVGLVPSDHEHALPDFSVVAYGYGWLKNAHGIMP